MPKEETLKVKGKVIEVLPNTMFKIKLDESETEILGHISGKMRKNNINVIISDIVDVEMSTYDLTKGRIVFRYKS